MKDYEAKLGLPVRDSRNGGVGTIDSWPDDYGYVAVRWIGQPGTTRVPLYRLDKATTGFVVTRDKWARGGYDVALHDESTGKMCCLGFYLAACGVTKEAMGTKTHACSLDDVDFPRESSWLKDGSDEYDLVNINGISEDEIDGSEREAALAEIFLEHGITVTYE